MRIANGMTGMRVLLSREDYTELSEDGKSKGIFVKVNAKSNPEDFLEFSRNEIPGSKRVNFVKTNRESKYLDVLVLSRNHFPDLRKLPMFAPEDVELLEDRSHSEAGWLATRPPMERDLQRNAPRKPSEQQVAKPRNNGLSRLQRLKEAVQFINEAKSEMGDDLVIEIRNGRVVLLIEVA